MGHQEKIPEWVKQISDHLLKKDPKYSKLLDNSFWMQNPEGFGVRVPFIFSAGDSPKQMNYNLRVYGIIKDVVRIESLDLIGMQTPEVAGQYTEELPLTSLAIGYFGRRPSVPDVDRIFNAYDTIEAKLKN